jgi:hypothetical protein
LERFADDDKHGIHILGSARLSAVFLRQLSTAIIFAARPITQALTC